MIKKVAATLEFGAIYTGVFPIFLLLMFFLSIASTALILFLSLYGHPEIGFGSIIIFLIAAAFLSAFIINQKNCKKVKLWIEDAVILTASSKSIGNANMPSDMFHRKAIKLRVTFKFQNKIITKESGKKAHSPLNGYTPLFRKYANRKIQILYSPKFDQVMIIKD